MKRKIVERSTIYLQNLLKNLSQTIEICAITTHFGKCTYQDRAKKAWDEISWEMSQRKCLFFFKFQIYQRVLR